MSFNPNISRLIASSSSAFAFCAQILVIDHYSPMVDCVRMSRVQFFTVTVLSFLLMLLTEEPTTASVWEARYAILYAGCFSSGVAYTCQIIGQKHVNPTVASLIMCLESVFGTLSGWLVLHEVLSIREISGCVVMFAAVILAQISPGKKK